MSKKTLLSESQIRQFMKLAKLEPLTPGFVEGITKNLEESHGRGRDEGAAGYGHPDANTRLEEDEESELHATEDELGHEDELADEEAGELDALEDEGDVDVEDAGDQMISVQDLMTAITSALEDVTGQPVESEIEDLDVEDEVEADVVDIDAVDDVAASMEDDTEMEMDSEPLEEGGDKKGCQSTEATDELVEQITKRVAARILKSALKKNADVNEGVMGDLGRMAKKGLARATGTSAAEYADKYVGQVMAAIDKLHSGLTPEQREHAEEYAKSESSGTMGHSEDPKELARRILADILA